MSTSTLSELKAYERKLMQKTIMYERALGKFNPLDNVVTYDDFDQGYNGWLDLTPNFVHPGYKQQRSGGDDASWGPIQLSSGSMRFASGHGSMEGTYSLKLSTRAVANKYVEQPAPGCMSTAIKRLSTFHDTNHIQIEAWYSYTPVQDREGIGEESIRAFGFFFDVQDQGHRWQPGVRYLNAVDGELVRRWQYWKASEGVTREQWCHGDPNGWQSIGIDALWSGRRFADGSADGFQWMPDGEQHLVYNEGPDKLNWIYMRLLIDYKKREYIEFQSQDRVFDMRGLAPTLTPPYAGISGLVNPVFYIETDTNRSVNMYLDSIVYSTN